MLLTTVLAVNLVCLAMTASSLSSTISSPSKKLLREQQQQQQECHDSGVIDSILNNVPNHVWESAASDLMERGVATGKSPSCVNCG